MLSLLFILGAAATGTLAVPTNWAADVETLDAGSLYVNEAPTYLRPYVMSHYATAQGVTIGSQLYRFYVTGPSSNYAFTLMGTNAPASSQLGVLPHHHRRHYENFFNLKGRFQLFAEPKNSGDQMVRTLTQHDYGSVTQNTTHTFKILDPDTELTGVIVPGGFEDLFLGPLGGSNVTSLTHTPYIPAPNNDSAPAGPDSTGISLLEGYDVYAQSDFIANVNSTLEPADAVWHTDSNTLGGSGEAYFIANGWGPKYLNSQFGYQIVQPLATSAQTGDSNFTLSIISISQMGKNRTVPEWKLPGSAAFQVLEGDLSVKIGTYPTVKLGDGDVAFIPGNITYSYWSDVAFTKTLYISGGFEGVDQKLIEGGKTWDYVVFPSE